MKQLQANSKKSFLMSTITLSLIVLVVVLLVVSKSNEIPAVFIGVPITLAGLFAIVGLFYGLKSISEESSTRKVLSIIFNSLIFVLFIAFILGDLMQ